MSILSDFLRRGIAALTQGKTVDKLTQTLSDELSRRATSLKIAHRVLDDKRGLFKIVPDVVAPIE